MARPTSLTPAVRQRVYAALKTGKPIARACALAGIGQSTYYRWMDDGLAAAPRCERWQEMTAAERRDPANAELRPKPADMAMWEFREAVNAAMAEAEDALLARVSCAAEEPKHWTAAAWILERRWPERYGRRQAIEMTADVRAKVEKIDVDELTDAELDEMIETGRLPEQE